MDLVTNPLIECVRNEYPKHRPGSQHDHPTSFYCFLPGYVY